MPTKDNNNQYVTKKDLKDELKRFATKEDLKNELKRFATKDDLKRFATKDDLKRFATKDDFNLVAGELVNLNTRMDRLEGIVQKVLNVVDGISRKFDEYKTEKAASEHTFLRHENQLTDHEKRIQTLEQEA